MNKLIFVTLLWAFSFSLIGEFLRGIDSTFAAFSRVLLALLCFLPFMKFRGIKKSLILGVTAIGAVQIGVMYIFYYKSFEYLSVPEVALFTIFTPFYVTIIYDLYSSRFRFLYLLSVAVAVLGALVIRYGSVNSGFITGFLLVQAANLCFGLGQSSYKYLLENKSLSEQKGLFGYFFVGACIVTFLAMIAMGDFSKMSISNLQLGVIIWLGIGASGFGYFLWNKGACEVDSGVLAIMNNALIPAAIIVNLVFWQKDTDLLKLTIGGVLMCLSLVIHKKITNYYTISK